MKNFKELANKERRALLLEKINNKVEGRLTKDQLETIVNKVYIDIDIDYEITVVKTAKELSSIAMLKEHEEEECGKETKEVGEIIFGDLVFGKDYYSSNSQYTYREEPNFPVDEALSFLKVQCYSTLYEDDDEIREIVVYLPKEEEPFEMDPRVKFILESFKIN